jgi:hypothetical protein
MATVETLNLSALYEQDETAWLETMSALAAEGRYAEMDYPHLSEYLADMAKRDRREVLSRLTTLIIHRLKWEHQPAKRSNSWRATMAEQRRELEELLTSGTLRNYAQEVLPRAYRDAVEQAALETDLPESTFPSENTRSLDEWMAKEVLGE